MDPITPTRQSETRFEFIGGDACLDFTNTLGGIRGGSTHENLTSYADLVHWSCLSGLLSEKEGGMLQQKAERDAEEGAAVLMRARTLREAIYHIFMALIAGTQPTVSDMEVLNNELSVGAGGACVVPSADGFRWEWRNAQGALDQMLGPVARSAATLLTSTERNLVRQCANSRCGWLFVDTTKNHRRQWCRTMVCGNKERVRRHRQKQHSASPSDMEA